MRHKILAAVAAVLTAATLASAGEATAQVTHNSSSFTYLENPQHMEPGARYVTVDSAGNYSQCSFGWFTKLTNTRDRIFNLTAGHCGNPGDSVYLVNHSGKTKIGEFVWNAYNGEQTISTGNDYGIIEIYPKYAQYIDATPNVSFNNRDVTLVGYRDATWLAANRPRICRLGYRTGLSCGDYRGITNGRTLNYTNISDKGDSGGAIWAMDPADPTGTKIYAVAVNSFMNMRDATAKGGKVIAPVMKGQRLTVLA